MFMFSFSIFSYVARIDIFLGRKDLKGTGVGGLKGHQNKIVRFEFFYFGCRLGSSYSSQNQICSPIEGNIAKGTTDPRVEFISHDDDSQFTNLEHITISESRLSIYFKISILTKSKVKILSKPIFKILTKIQLRNLNQTSAAKY